MTNNITMACLGLMLVFGSACAGSDEESQLARVPSPPCCAGPIEYGQGFSACPAREGGVEMMVNTRDWQLTESQCVAGVSVASRLQADVRALTRELPQNLRPRLDSTSVSIYSAPADEGVAHIQVFSTCSDEGLSREQIVRVGEVTHHRTRCIWSALYEVEPLRLVQVHSATVVHVE